jgi:hypothetical protein
MYSSSHSVTKGVCEYRNGRAGEDEISQLINDKFSTSCVNMKRVWLMNSEGNRRKCYVFVLQIFA